MKQLIKSFLPYGLVTGVQRRTREARRSSWSEATNEREHFESSDRYNYETSIRFLCERGTPEDQVRMGSMPETSLRLVAEILSDQIGNAQPPVGIHVGNFLGVSLAYLANAARKIHPQSLVIAVDPNIPHRGVSSPQHEVGALLDRFGLTGHALCVAAYSLEKSISNDGQNYSGDYDPNAGFRREHACEHGLSQLSRWLIGTVDFILLDGNHDEKYLARELKLCTELLRPGGILVLDDVSQGWEGIIEQFDQLGDDFERLACDGRIGVAKRKI